MKRVVVHAPAVPPSTAADARIGRPFRNTSVVPAASIRMTTGCPTSNANCRQANGQPLVLKPFNPFTETPVEGVHWRKGPNFGQPDSEGDFQQARTFRFSVGVRF